MLSWNPEWQKDTCDEARKTGEINESHLLFVLSTSPHYQEYLPKLWHKFNLDGKEIDSLMSNGEDYTRLWLEYHAGTRAVIMPDIKSAQARFLVWSTLFRRWTRSNLFVNQNLLRKIKILSKYTDHDQVEYIILNDLEDYFTNYLEIPLPALLFPAPIKANASDSSSVLRPRHAVVYDEAVRLHRANPLMDKVKAKQQIDIILKNHKYAPYGRTQFNRIIALLDFPPAPRGRKPAKHTK